MTRQAFSVAYTGNDRTEDHTIDVEALAPALLAFGRLIRDANAEINGKKSKVKVLVVSDFEHKCFNINFDTIISIGEHIKSLIGDDKVKTAKDVLEWIGLVKPTVMAGLSFLGYLALRRGRNIEEKREYVDENGRGLVSVRFEGEVSNVTVNHHIYNMSENPRILKSARDVFSPVGQDGINAVELRQEGEVVALIDPPQTQAIIASCNAAKTQQEEGSNLDVTESPAWLMVYSPVFDANAKSWRFRIGTDVAYVDISETKIAENAMRRGGAMTDDAYHVRLEISTPIDKNGKKGKPTYKILQVIKFVPANPAEQTSLFEDD